MVQENPKYVEDDVHPTPTSKKDTSPTSPIPELIAEELRRSLKSKERENDEIEARKKTSQLGKRINNFIENKLPVVVPEDSPVDQVPVVISGPKEMLLKCDVPIGTSEGNEGQIAQVVVMRELVGSGRPEFTIFFPDGEQFYRIAGDRGIVESKEHVAGYNGVRVKVPEHSDDSILGPPKQRGNFTTENVNELNVLMDRLQEADVTISVDMSLPKNSNLEFSYK